MKNEEKISLEEQIRVLYLIVGALMRELGYDIDIKTDKVGKKVTDIKVIRKLKDK